MEYKKIISTLLLFIILVPMGFSFSFNEAFSNFFEIFSDDKSEMNQDELIEIKKFEILNFTFNKSFINKVIIDNELDKNLEMIDYKCFKIIIDDDTYSFNFTNDFKVEGIYSNLECDNYLKTNYDFINTLNENEEKRDDFFFILNNVELNYKTYFKILKILRNSQK